MTVGAAVMCWTSPPYWVTFDHGEETRKERDAAGVRPRSVTAPAKLLNELRDLIQSTRSGVAQAVNSALVLLYWQVGNRIRTETLKSERAAYGEQIVVTLSRQLAAEFGNGYSRPNLFRMIRFAELFADREIVSTLSRQLSWSHFLAILPFKEVLRRDFAVEMRSSMQRTFAAGQIGFDMFRPRIMSWIGHARNANTYRLRTDLFRRMQFQRAAAKPSSAPGRAVNDQLA